MKPTKKRMFSSFAMACLAIGLAPSLTKQASAQDQTAAGPFQLTSSTFANKSTLPISTINNNIVNNVNACSSDGNPGGDQSPELSWTNAPPRTQIFVVVAYDVTAAFTHWGMYNIPATTTGLPANAGVPGSPYGTQIFNDFFAGPEYDGPCPPANVAPDVHRYVFTVYALDVALKLPGTPNFPPSSEALYHALIGAGRNRHILASASITGLYSSTPGK